MEKIKIGIIFCGYNEERYVKQSLNAFVEAKSRHKIYIAAASVPFKEYKDSFEYQDNSTKIIQEFYSKNQIDFFIDEPKYIPEAQVRNLCLMSLWQKNCDYIFLVDADELYTQENIDNIINFIQDNKEIDCFKISFKNYIFDENHWARPDFTNPIRIFRNNCHGGIFHFHWDNEVIYKDGKYCKDLNCIQIPEYKAFVAHMSWLNYKGKRKADYQWKHFGNCAYKWNQEKKSLEFNEEFFIKNNQIIPIVYKEI